MRNLGDEAAVLARPESKIRDHADVKIANAVDPADPVDDIDPSDPVEPNPLTTDEDPTASEPTISPELQNVLTLLIANNAQMQTRQNDALQAILSAQPSASHLDVRVDIQKPEEFSGSDSRKLHPFIFSCELNFSSNPQQFAVEENKINFAVSLFTGTALTWAQTQFSCEPVPDYLHEWHSFKEELYALFGEANPAMRAAMELEKLLMKDSHHAARFITDFSALAAELNWGDEALEHAFYRRLAPRLHTQLALVGRNRGLKELRAQVLELDQLYWQFEAEHRAFVPPTPPRQPFRTPEPARPASGHALHRGQSTRPHQPSTPRPSPANSPARPSRPVNEYLKGMLTADGKLKPKERKHRQDLNLCLYCGKSGHKVSECRSRSTQLKAATTVKTDASPSKSKPSNKPVVEASLPAYPSENK